MEPTRNLPQPEFTFLRAERLLDAHVVAVCVPDAVRPRVDEVHHAVQVRVKLVLVGDDDPLVLGETEVAKSPVGYPDEEWSRGSVRRGKADLEVVRRAAYDVVQTGLA
jgi:hypothetical protein